jgi:hypothetical protein
MLPLLKYLVKEYTPLAGNTSPYPNAHHMVCLSEDIICYKTILLFIGDLAEFNQKSILLSRKEFPSSCTLMELDVTGVTTSTDTNSSRNITSQDGLVYKKRNLQIKLEFQSGLFMKIEQKKDYSG